MLVADSARVSLDVFIQIPLCFLSASVPDKPQCVSKGIGLGFPKRWPHDPIAVHE